GHQAPRYRVAQPDALGLLLDVLSLTSDIALPVVGKLLGATVLKPATRALAAARVGTALHLGGLATDVAGVALSVNAALVERELERVGLLPVEGR
ncbi:MAG TPA: hypothetical protein PL137_04295, partial [Nocardioides sp.]|nr:hypothetical protein [Nocardioides sp.]